VTRATRVEVIELRARHPDGDLAGDFAIASDTARSGFGEELARGIILPVQDLDDGVQVSSTVDSSGAVRRYVDLESRCCSFLTLSARKTVDAVVLSVTGRPDAGRLISAIFATP
jgi:hypothetical protein